MVCRALRRTAGAPGERNAGYIESNEQIQRGIGPTGQGDRGAVALGNEKAPVGADCAGKAQYRRGFLAGVGDRLLLRRLALPGSLPLTLGEEDDRDHPEGGR